MATYGMTDRQDYARRRRRSAALMLAACAAIIAAAFRWPAGWLVDVAKVAGAYGLFSTYTFVYNQRQIMRRREITITVSPDGVRRVDPGGRVKDLARADIETMRPIVRRGGLVLRGSHPGQVLVVPADLEHFEACRAELVGMGIREAPVTDRLLRTAWAVSVLAWSFVALVVANTRVIQIAAGACLIAALIAMWALRSTWARARGARPAPDPTPEVSAKSKRLVRRIGIWGCAAGMALMLLQGWWTRSSDGIGVGFGVFIIAAFVFMVGFGTDGIGTAALIAAAWTKLSTWMPWLKAHGLAITGVFVAATGAWRPQVDHGATIAAGILLIAASVARNHERSRAVLEDVAVIVKGAALVLMAVALIAHARQFVFPALCLFLAMPDRSRTRAAS